MSAHRLHFYAFYDQPEGEGEFCQYAANRNNDQQGAFIIHVVPQKEVGKTVCSISNCSKYEKVANELWYIAA